MELDFISTRFYIDIFEMAKLPTTWISNYPILWFTNSFSI